MGRAHGQRGLTGGLYVAKIEINQSNFRQKGES